MMVSVDDFFVPLITAFVATGLGSLVSAMQARRAKSASDAEELEQSRQSEEISRLLSEAEKTLEDGLKEVRDVPVDDALEQRESDPSSTFDVSVPKAEHLNAMRSVTVERAVKKALEEFAERENASRARERKADRRFALWLAGLGFFGGSAVTIVVSWIFAAVTGAL
ncbi:hypothetical protein [Microbacterium murale]|uniref:Uncharacterized protein n=1 Tax=Microbacterium murale TaxID=1081040 RepID=A0ABU0P3Y9_9MICO|nr:hypothetical protein [Microbacterium murale]MDQ0642048.1 hypothetical protein [Microbacterium murale]